MTTAAERAVFVLDVDARRAEAGMARVRGKAAQAGAAFNAGGKGVGFFQARVEKAATAVTGMSSVLGGMGSQAGATFGAVSNLAAAFVAGGPLLAGVALATTGVAALVNSMRDVQAEEESTRSAIKDALQEAARDAQEQVKGLNDELQLLAFGGPERKAAKAYIDHADAIEQLGGKQKELTETNARANEVGRQIVALQFAQADLRQGKIKMSAEEQQKLGSTILALKDEHELLVDHATALRTEANVLEYTVIPARKAALETTKNVLEISERVRADRKAARASGGGRTLVTDPVSGIRYNPNNPEAVDEIARLNAITASNDALDEQKSKRAAMVAAVSAKPGETMGRVSGMTPTEALKAEALREESRRAFEASEDAKTKALKEALDEREAAQRLHAQNTQHLQDLGIQALQSSFMATASMTQQLAIMMLTEQEVTAEKMASVVLQGIGSQLVALGTQAIFEGGRVLLQPVPDPRGAALIALGGGAAAAGVAMGAAGAAVGASASASGAGAGGRGGSVGTVGSRGGGSSSAGGSGQVSTTIVFNGGTHLGDSTERARTMARDQRRASRNIWVPGGP